MKPPFTYYGGKTRLAPWIASLLPPHRVYVEPFFGSGSVLFAKPRAQHEIANDLDSNVVTFFRVLRERPDELELACRLSPYAREERDLCLETGISDELERARRFFVLVQQSFGHKIKGTGWSTSIRQGNNRARSTWNSIAQFAPVAERLVGVAIENRNALEVIEHYDTPHTLYLLDPPYPRCVRTIATRSWRPAGDYVHELQTDEEHQQLANVANACSGHVIICGYPSPLYDQLFDGWHTVSRTVPRSSASGRTGDTLPVATEVLWSNRPLDEGRLEGMA